MARLEDFLEGVKTVAVVGHVNPDGDCVGACLGTKIYLTENYPELKVDVYLQKVKDAFLIDIRNVLENGSRVQNRAVMAAVLRELPVFFNNHTEVMNYVRNALDGCRDEKEKKISVDLLRSYYQV